MAEVIGLAASLIQIAGAGVQLSTSLYNFVGSANRADSDIADIADDVQLTAITLDSVGKVFEREGGTCVVSRKAVQDAESLIKRCEAVFAEIQQMIEKRRRTGKDGKKLSTLGKFSWPMKEPRVELLRKRLESLKTSLQLLLQVILLANGQAKGEMEKQTLDKERGRIRELHQRQQESLKALQALEHKLSQVSLSDDETLHGSSAPSRVPTIDLMVNASNSEPRSIPPGQNPASPRLSANFTTFTDGSETSGSDGTTTDDENDHISAHELTQCAGHVQKLLKRINSLQHTLEDATLTHAYPRHRVQKLYRRFCRKFESGMVASNSGTGTSIAPLPEFVPPSRVSTGATTTMDHRPGMLANSSYLHGAASNLPVQLQEGNQLANIHRLNNYGDQSRSQLAGNKARSDVPSRGSSKESFQTAAAEDDNQNYQGSGEIHRTKTGRISKAKKGLKVHSCECGKSYTRAEHLRRHQKNHTSDDVVQCDLCGRTFYRRDLLERHMGRHKERLASHNGDANSGVNTSELGLPSTHPSTFSYTHTIPLTDSPFPRPSSAHYAPEEKPISGEKAGQPSAGDVRAGRPQIAQQPQITAGTQYSWQPAPPPRSNPASPRSTSNQMRYGSVGSPQRRTHTPTNIPYIDSSERPQFAPSFGHSTRHSVSSYGHGSPATSHTAQEDDVKIKTRGPDDATDRTTANSPAHDVPSPASPYGRSTGAGEHASPRTFPGTTESAVTLESRAGLDTNTHHSGFTPVNSMRREGNESTQYQSTDFRIQRGRTGPLSSDQRALASQMRSITACANCKQLKQKCDTEVPCSNCRKHALRSGYLPESTCRGQTLANLSNYSQGGAPYRAAPRVSTETGDEIRNGMRREEDLARKPAPVPGTNSSQNTPADEVLQRLVEEAGSDKRLESRRADRKAFFDNHWALPQQEFATRPATYRGLPPTMVTLDKPKSSHKSSTLTPYAPDESQSGAVRDADLQSPNISAQLETARGKAAPTESLTISPASGHESRTGRALGRTPSRKEQNRRPRVREKDTKTVRREAGESEDLCVEDETASVISDAPESANIASPPPEPADKTSEEWISWKRARLSEGTGVAKRKREREDKAETTLMTSPTQQQYGISPYQAAAMAPIAAAGPAGTSIGTHRRKKSKVVHVTSGPGDGSRRDDSRGTVDFGQQDEAMGEREEEEKDIVDLLLEQWTVPV